MYFPYSGKLPQNLPENTSAGVSFWIKLHATDLQLHVKQDSTTGSFYEFCKIYKITFTAEDYRTTALIIAVSIVVKGELANETTPI